MALREAYDEVCRALPRLCPRLVPSPLWGISIASIVRCDPAVLAGMVLGAVDGSSVEMLRGLRRWWFSLPRDRCVYCGSRARDIDEEWRYFVEGSRGVAELVSVEPVCRLCHLAKHVGYAAAHGLHRLALERLAEINDADPPTLLSAVQRALDIQESLSSIRLWRIVVDELPGLGRDLRRFTEMVLNAMQGAGLYVCGCVLVYEPRDLEALDEVSTDLGSLAALLEDLGIRLLVDPQSLRGVRGDAYIVLGVGRLVRGIAAREIASRAGRSEALRAIEVDCCGGGEEVRILLSPRAGPRVLGSLLDAVLSVVNDLGVAAVPRIVAEVGGRRVVMALL